MFFNIGTKIQLIHTGDKGVITEVISDTMVTVRLDEGNYEIPVSLEDITRQNVVKTVPKPKNKHNAPSKPKKQAIACPARVTKQKPTGEGVLISFVPTLDAEGIPSYYTIYVVNDNMVDIIFELSLRFGGQQEGNFSGNVRSGLAEQVCRFAYDDLNESPSILLKCWQLTTTGTANKQEKETKIKAKSFFKKQRHVDILQYTAHTYPIFKFNKVAPKASPKANLTQYTKENIGFDRRINEYVEHFKTAENKIKAREEFNDVLDLHIDKLNPSKRKMTRPEMLQLQIKVFNEFLDNAVRAGIPQLFVIHGIGKGRLKKEIHSILIINPHVKNFKNEYHKRYGFGATEIFLD